MTDTIGNRVRERLASALGASATQGDLAAKVGMSPDAMSRAINGQRQFATLELVRLANVLGVSLHWLATGEEDPSVTRVAARHTFDHELRAHEAVDWSAERTAIETIATAYAQVNAATEASREAVPVHPAEARSMLLANDADFVRNFAQAVEQTFGIDVVRVEDAHRPYSIEAAGRRVIVVPPHANWFYQNWSIAHELGHFASGNLEPVDTAPVATGPREVQANAYAAELLLPENVMRRIDWAGTTAPELAENLWRWGVSTPTLRARLATLAIVPSEGVRELLAMPTQRVLRRHWVDNGGMWVDSITDRMERASTRRFPSFLLTAHTEAVARGEVGPAYLAWMLGTDEASLDAELAPHTNEVDLDWLASELGLPGPETT
jgi:Zn-dependent peptidase ImmA (M78 family)/plasmid maintenance system antidote protein VapI